MESVDVLNKRLFDYFGCIWDGRPAWRIVFSDDQLEKRLDDYEDYSGNILIRRVREVREVPKYWWIKHKYVLERLFEVPDYQQGELLKKTSYEPIWIFEDNQGNPLPPTWLAIEFIMKAIDEQLGRTGKVKYVDKEDNPEEVAERVKKMQEDLFGNETDVTDHLAYKTGVVVPQNFKEKN